jgi:Uma2 family endonuclease
MSTTAEKRYTPQQYLELERASETKHEYYAGQIYAMAGASLRHNAICYNLLGEFRTQLKTGACRGFGSDMRLKIESIALYTYPDVTIVCGDPILEDGVMDTILNPKIVFEVLSPSTERHDRGFKSTQYRTIESLSDYALIAQDSMHVEHYRRAEGEWVLKEYFQPTDTVIFDSIGCSLSLGEVYDRVAFDQPVKLHDDQLTQS